MHLVPGDPVDIMLGVPTQTSIEVRASIREDLGLNQPIPVQYLNYLGKLLSLDLGTSYRLQQPVAQVIGAQIGATAQLAVCATALAVTLALVVALGARWPWAKKLASLLELLAISAPTFWVGLLLLTLFSFTLRWFPVSSGQGLSGLVLPSITMALPIAGILSQLLRHGLNTAAQQPFVETARARGLGFRQLLLHHTLRHAALSPVTMTAYILGNLLGGAVIIEQLFGRPGVGRVALDAITNRDLPVVMALVVLSAVVFVTANIVVDLLYPLLDPRLRRVS
jgi:peptide/nickel transport system permease protein